MSINGIFNQKGQKEPNKNDIDKINLRMNALEVQLKKLLDFEKQLRLSMYKSTNKPSPREEVTQEYTALIEKMITEKLAVHLQNEDRMKKRILLLETQISELIKRDREQTNSPVPTGPIRTEEHRVETDQKTRKLLDSLENRLLTLESNFVSVYESHQVLIKQVEDLQNKPSDYFENKLLTLEQNFKSVYGDHQMLIELVEDLQQKSPEQSENMVHTEDTPSDNFRTVYIDKIYVDKYEQINNFAQLGIKSLSGSLNIGATYGTVPKEVNEQIKKDIEKIKADKEEMQHQNNEDQSVHPHHEQTSSESKNPQSSKDYTEIQIEED